MRFKVLLSFFLPLLLHAGTDTGTILLHNDTTVILTAIVQAADGSYLGQFTVQPGQQRNWTSNLYPSPYKKPGTPDSSLTPYTVIWQCPSEGIYSICTGVSPGAYINASACSGGHYCAPKKGEEKQDAPPASKLKKKS